jgi:hypothetical protein
MPPRWGPHGPIDRCRGTVSTQLTQLLNCAERLICLLSVSGKKAFVAAISYTIMEALLEELSYDASECAQSRFLVNVDYVKATLDPILADQDLAKYIL